MEAIIADLAPGNVRNSSYRFVAGRARRRCFIGFTRSLRFTLFYNPNIHPEKEYLLRFHELEKVLEHYDDVSVVPAPYETRAYFDAVKGFEDAGEHSVRCEYCIEERMRKTAEFARVYDYFTTTLSISPYKDAAMINRIGEKLEAETGARYLYADFKKKDGYKHSIEWSKTYGLYRQDYCGCVFSRREREEQNAD